MADIQEKLRPLGESLVEPGEELLGICIGTNNSAFKSRQVVIATTPGRLVVQETNRKLEPKGEPLSIAPEQIAKVSSDGAGGGWANIRSAITDAAAASLKIRTTDGEKLNLMMMRGGDSLLGRMGGGEVQEQGLDAIADWFARHAEDGRG